MSESDAAEVMKFIGIAEWSLHSVWLNESSR